MLNGMQARSCGQPCGVTTCSARADQPITAVSSCPVGPRLTNNNSKHPPLHGVQVCAQQNFEDSPGKGKAGRSPASVHWVSGATLEDELHEQCCILLSDTATCYSGDKVFLRVPVLLQKRSCSFLDPQNK